MYRDIPEPPLEPREKPPTAYCRICRGEIYDDDPPEICNICQKELEDPKTIVEFIKAYPDIFFEYLKWVCTEDTMREELMLYKEYAYEDFMKWAYS